VIISDQGREFVNNLNKELFRLTGTDHRVSSAYHPQTNGLVERFNQTIQRALVKLVRKEQDDWDMYIDGVLFAYRTSTQKSTKATPFELMFLRKYTFIVFKKELTISLTRKPVLPVKTDFSNSKHKNINRLYRR
jgi:transposase InsO family protein